MPRHRYFFFHFHFTRGVPSFAAARARSEPAVPSGRRDADDVRRAFGTSGFMGETERFPVQLVLQTEQHRFFAYEQNENENGPQEIDDVGEVPVIVWASYSPAHDFRDPREAHQQE